MQTKVQKVGIVVPQGRTLCHCRLCDRVFLDPHDGKCPHCESRYIELADLSQAAVIR